MNARLPEVSSVPARLALLRGAMVREDLAAYFAEDHAGLRGGAHRTPAQDPDFPARTEAVLERLERSAVGPLDH